MRVEDGVESECHVAVENSEPKVQRVMVRW
jgi:hypothetical protein